MLRLRQIAFAATDLAAAERALEAALGLRRCFRDPGVAEFGLHNALYPVGDQFLEIVSPMQPGTTAGRLLERRGGDCGYMALFQVDDLDAARARIAAAHVRIVYEAVAPGVHGLHLHPKDVPGAIVSIDRTDAPAEWPWGGPVWREHVDTSCVCGITALEVHVSDPASAVRVWGAVLGADRDGDVLRLDDGVTIRFVDAASSGRDGIAAIGFATPDRPPGTATSETRELLGVTLRFDG